MTQAEKIVAQGSMVGVRKYRLLVGVLVGSLFLATCWGAYRYWRQPKLYSFGALGVTIDLLQPAALLSTQNLADLPKDIADATLLKGLVDEQLVFHYQEDEESLSLEGSLRRIAYEHELRLQDRFLANLMKAPAELAFWQSAKGRPEFFVASIERSALSTLTQVLGKIAANDGQLQLVSNFSIAGQKLPMYILTYGAGHTLALVTDAKRWVIFSRPELALGEGNQLTDDAQDVLNALFKGKNPWKKLMKPTETVDEGVKHSLVMGPSILTLGYSRFLSGLKGLRFDFRANNWQTYLRVDAEALPKDAGLPVRLQSLWNAVPASQALCTAQLVDWGAVAKPLDQMLGEAQKVATQFKELDALMAVCWFAQSRLNAPLFVVRSKSQSKSGDASRALFAELAETMVSQGESVDVQDVQDVQDDMRITTQIDSVHGPRELPNGKRGFAPTLVQHGAWIYFSPDQRNVDAALAVAKKRAPALGDSLPPRTWLSYQPQRLAKLVRLEMNEVLPANDESYFREIARTQFWPRLEAWGQLQRSMNGVLGKTESDGFAPLALQAATSVVKP